MEVYISKQLLCLLYSVILGAFSGLIYDFLKLIRAVANNKITITKLKNKLYDKKHLFINQIPIPTESSRAHKIKMFFWDLLFFIILIPITAIFTYATSDGIARWYIFFGMSVGFILYYVLISRLTKYIYEPIIYLLILLKQYLKLPFKVVFSKIQKRLSASKIKRRVKRKNKQNIKRKEKRQELISVGKKH